MGALNFTGERGQARLPNLRDYSVDPGNRNKRGFQPETELLNPQRLSGQEGGLAPALRITFKYRVIAFKFDVLHHAPTN